MAVNFLLKRSNTASKRPTAAQLDIGELSLNYDANTAGVFFEDGAGNVRKVGPAEVSATAPNATPAGSSGNSLGEFWYDTGATNLKIWTGSAFVNATTSITGSAGSATNLLGGSIGTIPYQSGTNTTAMLAVGTAGQALVSAGAAAPTWATLTMENIPDAAFKRSVRAATTADLGASTFAAGVLTGYDDVISLNVTTTISSTTATTTSTAGIKVGAVISGNANIPAATTVASITNATTFVMSAAATAAGTAVATTFTQTISALVVDGITLALNDRVLVKNQSTLGGLADANGAAKNGIYRLSTLGSATVPWVLTRAADADTASEIAGAIVNVDSGTTNGGFLFDNDFKTTDTLDTTLITWNRVVDTGLGNTTAATIAMNGTQAAGTSDLYARADHVHPTDTSRAATNQTMFIGTTSFAINRASAAQSLTGITSIDGSAATLTTTRTLWGQNFNGGANVTGSLTSVGDITATAAITISSTTTSAITVDSGTTGNVNLGTNANAKAIAIGNATVASTIALNNNTTLPAGKTLTLSGATSGTIALQATATAGTNTITFPATTGTVALTANNLGVFAATTSAQLAGVISDETGTGSLVFGTNPLFDGETYSTSAAVTAGTNAQGQGALTSDYNVITTAASAPSGVTLPTATVGRRIIIVNKGANAVNIYPATGAAIDALAANASIQLAVNGVMMLNAASTTLWYSSANMQTVGAVADGDKGDITVSGTGSTWTIDNTVVTYAKIQNVSTNNRILGRSTAGAGSIEELTTIPATVLGNSSLFVGTTSIALNRASAAQSLTGITSIDGSAATLTTTRTLWGQNFNGGANVTGSLTSVGDITATAAITISSTTTSAITVDSGTTGNVNLGTNANAKAIAIGNATVASTIALNNNTTLPAGKTLTLSGATSGTIALQATATAGTNTITFPATTGTVALTANNLSVFAATTSAQLAGVISDETGSGSLVFNTNPALDGETFSTAAAVTAGTNAQGQGALTSDYNVITTAAANPSGVTLPTATTGRRVIVVNKGANPINVYPATGGTIDALAVNTSIQIAVGGVMIFNASSTTQWYSTTNIVANAGYLTGTIPSGVLGNSSFFIGTTSIALNRASAAQSLTGITSIDGSAATLTTTRTLWGQNFNGSANVTGSLTSVGDITGSAAITLSSAAASNLTLNSGTTGIVTLDSGSTGAVNIGNNANAKTITLGNVTGATTINVNSGTGGILVTSPHLTMANQGALRLREATGGGTNYIGLQAPAAVAADLTFTVPGTDATTTTGYTLKSNGSAALSFGTANIVTSDTAPSSPLDGDLWYDSASGRLFVYYADINTNQWVDASPDSSGVSNIRILDSIAASFNGTTATFNLTVSAAAVSPVNAQQLLIVVGGVVQMAGTHYTVSGSTITFTAGNIPTSGLTFYGVIYGDAATLNTIADGAVTTAKIQNASVTAAKLSIDGNVLPTVDNTYNLGSASFRFANVYTGDLHLKNDRGDWTIIEEDDCLTMRNNKTGKIYEIMMKERTA